MGWVAFLLAFDTFGFLFEAGADYVQFKHGIVNPMPDQGLVGFNVTLGIAHLAAFAYAMWSLRTEVNRCP